MNDLRICAANIMNFMMAGLAFAYWFQSLFYYKIILKRSDSYDINDPGPERDYYTSAFTLITWFLAICSIGLIVLRASNSRFLKISLGIAVTQLFLWLAALIVYCIREYKEGEKEELREYSGLFPNKIPIPDRIWDISRSVIYMILSSSSIFFHIFAGVLRNS